MKCLQSKVNDAVLLAMPVYNEQKYIAEVLDSAKDYIDNIVIIDDGSTDGTKDVLAARRDVNVISRPKNKGYGQAIIDAFHFARAGSFQWLITMDCDLQHDPALLPEFFAAINADDCDIISGSRYMDASWRESSPPQDRRFVNRFITAMVNSRLGLHITDGFCGFKGCRVSAISKLELTERGYAIPLEFWVQAAYHNLVIKEIPVSLIYNDPNRYFGGNLDKVENRLHHYVDVFNASLARVGWEASIETPPTLKPTGCLCKCGG